MMIDRNKIPPHGKPIDLVLEEPGRETLDNGMDVYLIHAGNEEVIRLDIVVEAGSVYQQKKLTASSVGKLLKEGTKKYSSSEIAGIIDFCGAYLDVAVTKDSAIITLYTLSKYLEQLIPVVGDMLLEANFPEEELNIHIDRNRQEFLINSEKVRYKAMLEFNKLVFGKDSAYGQVLELTDFDLLERHDLFDFYNKYYHHGNAYLLVSGKIPGNTVALLNKYLGSAWKQNVMTDTETPSAGLIDTKRKYVEKPDAMQSAIRVGKPIVSRQHPDYNRFLLLNTVLGGYFGSRLISNLREDKGYTYGVSSFVTNYKYAGYFSVSTEVNVQHTDAALDEICHEMELLRTAKVGEDELMRVKNYIYGTFLRTFDGPFALAERFKSAREIGEGFAYYQKSLNEMLQVSADELLEVANKYLNPKDMITLVVGKANHVNE
jgi:predicted Zn-dependent peptidase